MKKHNLKQKLKEQEMRIQWLEGRMARMESSLRIASVLGQPATTVQDFVKDQFLEQSIQKRNAYEEAHGITAEDPAGK